MKALIIGGAGFIGSHLCAALLERGNEVVCMDDLSLGTLRNIADLRGNALFSFIKGNATDSANIMGIMKRTQPDIVYHLAANSDIQLSADNPKIDYEKTYTTTFCILNAMRECSIKRMFFASTSAVYGDKRDVLLDEKTPELAPVSYYGAAKLGSEALISSFSYMNDMSILVFRFPNVIGPHLTHGVVHDFIERLSEDPRELRILGDGHQTKPYIYVADLVDAICAMMEKQKNGVQLYNVGVDSATSVTRIADIICEEMGLEGVSYLYTGGEGGWKGDVPRFSYCLDKIHATGWHAKYDSDEAVRATVRAVLAERIKNNA